ncbi:secretin receptor-like [Littorina saxatilis]|uniref:secretin receptor-like n=1 Tax=Littorina saxatilis TaxID=31220 RepID=UPI0038B5CF0F
MAQEQGSVEITLEEQKRRINEARSQCRTGIPQEPDTPRQGPYCNQTWDGIMCWPQTRGGELVEQGCPAYVHGFVPSGTASKQCGWDGQWYYNVDYNRTWTNFSQCYAQQSLSHVVPKEHLERIKVIYSVGYGVSLVTLTAAIFIMIYFRRLHCPRNTVHLNLFVAFVLRATLSFLRDNLLVNHLGLPSDVMETETGDVIFKENGSTHWQCKLLFSTFNYVLAASGMWIFVEGLYLHTLIIIAVFSERNHIRYYIILGWGGPLVFMLPWVIIRATVEDVLCWNTHPTASFYWILIKGPTVVTTAVNFVFFINIVRVLFTKLVKTAPPRARRFRYRRLAKSTLVLIPLFGVHYIVFLGLPENVSPTAELVKLYYEMFFNSFQGFFIACLFCFMNGEVKAEIRKKWIRYKLRTNSRKFQKIYWQTSSSHFTRKHSGAPRCIRENSSSNEKRRDSREINSSSSGNPALERHRFRFHIQQVKYSCRPPAQLDLGPDGIILMCKRNSFV